MQRLLSTSDFAPPHTARGDENPANKCINDSLHMNIISLIWPELNNDFLYSPDIPLPSQAIIYGGKKANNKT